MERIKQTYTIKAPIDKVWQALTDPEIISEWGGGPAKMSAKVGDNFSLWGGGIYGKNLEVVPRKHLTQEWDDGTFEQPTWVNFELEEKSSATILQLVQTNIPGDRKADLAEGWRDYYLGPLKALLER